MRTVAAALAVVAVSASAAAQTPAGPEFRVNTYTTRGQHRVRPAMEPDGDFVAVWMSSLQDGDAYGVFGQRFAASGAPRGGEFRVNTYTTGYQGKPQIAVGHRGDFVVVWESDPDGTNRDIRGRRYDAAGTAIGGEFPVNTFTTADQSRPNVGRAADGRFVVIWESDNVDGSSTGIAARRFDASGDPIGGEFVVNTYTTGFQITGNLAVEADGDFVAVWEDLNGHDGFGDGIFGQRFDASGNRSGNEFLVNSYTTNDQSVPSVSVSPAGGFAVVWTSFRGAGISNEVFARRFDAAGNPLGSDFAVNTYTTGAQQGYYGQVAHDAGGNFVVTWYGPGDGSLGGSFGQRFSASGARRGLEFRVNTYTTSQQVRPSVASDSAGNFLMSWISDGQDGSSLGIFGQRFGGLGPAALGVDTGGNFVLEPGETVDVRPAWRNVSGATQMFSGTLSNFAGPTGATYAIDDGAGDYGAVVDGSTAPCSDCYSVSVSDPGPRPATHWDASVVETLAPPAHGQQKEWRLHVGRSFTDVPATSPFYRFVEVMLHYVLTTGCTPTLYCPGSSTTREQMAVFVLIAKEGMGYLPPACGATPMFGDVPVAGPFCRWIEELARRGVAGGCGGGNYCPSASVTRDQMAIFVLRTLDPAINPPACGTPVFADVPASSPFCRWVEELARRGIVSGCGGGNYCPSAAVTREQMGVFLGATFGLTLYGP